MSAVISKSWLCSFDDGFPLFLLSRLGHIAEKPKRLTTRPQPMVLLSPSNLFWILRHYTFFFVVLSKSSAFFVQNLPFSSYSLGYQSKAKSLAKGNHIKLWKRSDYCSRKTNPVYGQIMSVKTRYLKQIISDLEQSWIILNISKL